MIQYDETRLAMEALTPQIEELRGALNLDGIKIKVDELEMKSTEPNFWDDPEKAQAVQQQIETILFDGFRHQRRRDHHIGADEEGGIGENKGAAGQNPDIIGVEPQIHKPAQKQQERCHRHNPAA